MLTTPKKTAGKTEKVLSDTASFKKVAYGFSPEEVNLYLHTLRKKTLELQAENEKLLESVNPEKLAQAENLERHLTEANEKYFKERDLVVMLEGECKRLGAELDELNRKLRDGGSADDKAKAKLAENRAAKAEFSLSKAEAKAAEALDKAARLEESLSEFKAKATEYKMRLDDAEEKLELAELTVSTGGGSSAELEEAQKRAKEAEAKAKEAKAKVSVLEEKIDDLKAKNSELRAELLSSDLVFTDKKTEEMISSAEKRAAEAEKEASQAKTRVSILEERLSAAKAETAEYKSQLGEAKGKLLKAGGEASEKTKEALSAAEKRAAEAEKRAESAAKEAKEAASKVSAVEEKLAKAENELNKAKAALTEAEKAAKTAEERAAAAEKNATTATANATAAANAVKPVAAKAPAKTAPAKETDAPIFEEAPAARDESEDFLASSPAKGKTGQESETQLLASKLSSVLAEIDDLKSKLNKTKENAEEAEESAEEVKKAKKQRRSDDGDETSSGRLSRAELKIQIIQEDAEDSYIIPDKYIKMIEDIEEQDDDDDFSYLLTDAAPTDDMMMTAIDDDDDISNLLISGGPMPSSPSFKTDGEPKSKPSRAERDVVADIDLNLADEKKPAVSPRSNAKMPDEILIPDIDEDLLVGKPKKKISAADAEPPISSPIEGLIKHEKAEIDRNFEDLLNLDFRKPKPKGENIKPKNPAIKEKGEDLAPLNPNAVEKGDDLDSELFGIVAGEAGDPNKNIRARSETNGDFTGAGYDFLLENDDSDMI